MKASAIADLLDAELHGGADPEITGAAPLDRAGPRDLSFVARARYVPYVAASDAGVLLVAAEVRDRVGDGRPRIVVEDVHVALAKLLPRLYPESSPDPGVHETAVVAADADVAGSATIGPYSVVGSGCTIGDAARLDGHVVVGRDCTIGREVRLHAHVTVHERTVIGARTIVHSGARIGVEGFGFAPVDGVPRKVPQVGNCVIGADVEIGANVTIDRGSLGSTEIGDHVKIDNLVHVGHNVTVGPGTIIVAQVGISGSTRIGQGVTLAGQVGVAGHVEIGDGATLGAQAGVFGDIPAGETWSGYPARPHSEALRAQANLFRLGKLRARVRRLEEEIEEVQDGE